ncbi:hypothetical protein [Streptomyces sp. A5-4]|uniref:hypothetical protein n=1 Tax=Streptomyces sp. A5-4 TaxID=3384771 RepID=UPI003DA94FB2
MSGPPPPQHNPYNPYNQPPPMQPGGPYPPQPVPFGPQPPQARRGSPVGAVFLAFFASVVISAIYAGILVATYEDQTPDSAHTLYVAHSLVNGVAVGALIGLVGRRSGGAGVAGAIIAALGAFFGYTNALPIVLAVRETPSVVLELLEHEPFFPARAWWGDQSGIDWVSPLGLLIAAGSAWGLAYAVGRRR